MRPIRRLAVLNRGEAASRCIRAVKALRAREGHALQAIAFYTAIDCDAPFVRHADLAVELPSSRGEVAAWLDHDALVGAVLAAGADAVWPGWGFVSEDPVFVERLEALGLRFLGPSAAAMRALGDKIDAKRAAERAGVAVAPWSGGALDTPAEARDCATRVGYPLVLKAAAGGGGRGIRLVRHPGELEAAFASAAAEARAAFGDPRLFLEKWIAGGRHVEVQIAADLCGHTLALGCRDCSVQRRHQKVVEETPPPGLAPERLRALEQAAVRLAAASAYTGVGTVEFLVDAERHHFLEVNPRLQVEHGLTEVTTGIDLVELQIRIARGESIEGLCVAPSGAAVEARICAEDPEAGFLPSPGRIARFDASLGPGIRVDAGVAVGSAVPAAFDSLVAKVIAHGPDRETARARLVAALSDLDLVIEGGASNKGWLVEILEHPEFRRGGVDTAWLDRFAAGRDPGSDLAEPALVAAAILSYQRRRALARLNFYRDPARLSGHAVPAAAGLEIDLTWAGTSYRLQVYAIGSWRYRVRLDGRAVTATLREEGAHLARLQLGDRTLRVLYDVGDTELRVEVEGRAHRFGSRAAGEVRAAAPAVVVAIHVAAGDAVEAGQPLGLLEAMKMEVRFDAPVSGVVREVRVRPGQQAAAGDLLLVIDPSAEAASGSARAPRVTLSQVPDPLAPLVPDAEGVSPDLAAADRLPPAVRREAVLALREEVRRVLLGYDAQPERTQELVRALEAPLPADLSDAFRGELAGLGAELVLFADLARLFIRSPAASVSGAPGPSNDERLRMYVRRIRAAGAGITEEFLELVRRALAHYGIHGLEPCDALERAVMRLLASQRGSPLRDPLVLGLLRRVVDLARHGSDLSGDAELGRALDGIAGMRGLVGDAVADAAIEAGYLIFQQPGIEREAERTTRAVGEWLDAAEDRPTRPPEPVLLHLADAPPGVFERVGRWLGHPDPRRHAIALAATLRRLYSPAAPLRSEPLGADGERAFLADGRQLLAAACAPADLERTAARLLEAAGGGGVAAVELIASDPQGQAPPDPGPIEALARRHLRGGRLTLSFAGARGPALHWTFRSERGRVRRDDALLGIHPEAAARIDLARLVRFEVERLPAGDDLYCLHVRSRDLPDDERIFVLADLRSRSPEDGREATLHLAAFERLFFEATRVLRAVLAERDPGRRLQWNRIFVNVAPEVFLEPALAERLSQRLTPATRNLGLEKVVVRLPLLDRARPRVGATPTEVVISNASGERTTLEWRSPRVQPLSPRSEYERRVAEARRRRLAYPYEIIRMLAGKNGGATLPPSYFEEYDLDPASAAPRALSAAGRPYGRNRAGVVFGVIETPTAKVPEGLRRVLILSDPTRGMGSLAGPECDRVLAALDLAESLGVPVEWLPVSSGARIAMDSGTENLDATARVVRRIVEFTLAGGAIHVIATGVNVGAQSYWNALSTMLMHTRGVLIMTPGASMVLTGRAALEASGAVSAEDELAIGGFQRVMGPNGEAQYFARDLVDAYRILYEHYAFTYVVPGEERPRRLRTRDPADRPIGDSPCDEEGFGSVGEIFDDASNPGRKRPFPMRAVMRALVDRDGGWLERWQGWVGAETTIVWDAHLGGYPVCLIGLESRNLPRHGYTPGDGPEAWNGGTLFPLSSKKMARALRAASGNRPVVILANLSGFDGSPESMRKLQLEYGAEIAQAVVTFRGPILFLVVSRYHGGAYVVFSRALNPGLRAAALSGSYASVIGGSAAAAVVFSREARARAASDPRVRALRGPEGADADRFEATLEEVVLEKQAEIAREFDAVHSVERARQVGSLEAIVEPARMRAYLIDLLAGGTGEPGPSPG